MKRSILNKAKMSENKKKNPANKEYCGDHPRRKKAKENAKMLLQEWKWTFPLLNYFLIPLSHSVFLILIYNIARSLSFLSPTFFYIYQSVLHLLSFVFFAFLASVLVLNYNLNLFTLPGQRISFTTQREKFPVFLLLLPKLPLYFNWE